MLVSSSLNFESKLERSDLNRILRLLRARIEETVMSAGLCRELFAMELENKITREEGNMTFAFIKDNKPSTDVHSDFLNHPEFIGQTFFWNYGRSLDHPATIQRRLFVDRLIEMTS